MRRLGLTQPEEQRKDSKGNAHFQIGSQMNKGMRGHVGSSSLGEVAQAGPAWSRGGDGRLRSMTI
jgi:hypothetical protein